MSTIDDIKQKLDLVELVSEYTSLQKSGRNFKALCPFHDEKTPSFFVFPEQQSWHCFGACGIGGDIFSLIMKKEGLDFGQALRLLAEKAGIPLVAKHSRHEDITHSQKETLFQINETAAEYYHHLLLHTSTGEMAKNYVVQRGLSSQIINAFQLGFSKDSFEDLKQHLKSRGYEESQLIAAGLIAKREDGSGYDRFRNRLMFPIRDIQSRVIGFGARALDESLPKYLNSPQTLVFDKSSSLYAIERAKTAIHKHNLAIITEGYMDVLTAHHHGWENTVASMGTAITEKQLTVLKKLTKNLILALDADAAGEKATLRSVESINNVLSISPWFGLEQIENYLQEEVKVIILPQGKDPDEVIKENPSSWAQLLTTAQPIVDFILNTITAEIDLESAESKSSAVDKLLPLLSEMKDPLKQAHYVERLAHILKTDEHAVRDALKKFRAVERRRRTNKNFQSSTIVVPTSSTSNPPEEYCLALLLQYPDLKSQDIKLLPDYIERNENRELLIKWQQNTDITSLRDSLDSILHEHLDGLLTKVLPPTLAESEIERQQTLNDCIIRLQERALRSLEARKEELLATEDVTTQLTTLEEQGIEGSQKLKEVFTKRGYRQQPATKRGK